MRKKCFLLLNRIVFWLITLMTVMPSFLSAYTAIDVLAAETGTVQTALPMDDGTASATGTVNGSGTAVDWVVTVTKFDSEDERVPKLELEYSSGLGTPYNISTSVQQINRTDIGAVTVLKGYTYSTAAETLTMSFTTDITDHSSETISLKILAGTLSEEESGTVDIFMSGNVRTLSLVNPIAQAAAEAAAQAEAEAIAQAEAEAVAQAEAEAAAQAAAEAAAQAEAEVAAQAEAEAAARAEAEAAAQAEAEAAAQAEAEAAAQAEAEAAAQAEAEAAVKAEAEAEAQAEARAAEVEAEKDSDVEQNNFITEEAIEEKISEIQGDDPEIDYEILGISPILGESLPYSWQPVFMQRTKINILLSRSLMAVTSLMEYTTDSTGTYPTNFTQTSPDIRNYNPIRHEIDAGWVSKSASETATDGQFEINLKVEGKTITETETTDIVLVLDNSNSMNTNARDTKAKAAAQTFINGLLTGGTNIRMALVTYGSVIFNSYSYTTLTTDKTQLLNLIPGNVPSERNDAQNGGTFTQLALNTAGIILQSSTATNKVVILLSDGVPTYSYKATAAVANTGSYNLINYQGVPGFPPAVKATTFGSGLGTGMSYDLTSSQQYNVARYGVKDHGFATMSQALLLKSQNIDIYGVGIELTEGGDATLNEALNVMKNISTNSSYYYNASQADQINAILQQISSDVTKTISGGSIIDPMGSMVNLSTGANAIFDAGDYNLSASNNALLTGVTVTANSSGQITVNGLNLGHGEWVNLSYKVNVRTEDTNFTPEMYYQTNGYTYLTPKSTQPEISAAFPIPSVKAPGENLSGQKIWENDTSSDRPISISLQLKRYIGTEPSASVDVGGVMTVSDDGNGDNIWDYTFGNLPSFDNLGRDLTYIVTEVAIPDYGTSYDGFNIINRLQVGQLDLLKVDEEGNPITGENMSATFELYNNGSLIATESTDTETGRLSFTNIKVGSYTLIESVSPSGYEINPTEYTVIATLDTVGNVVVSINNVVITPASPLEVVNTLKVGTLSITKQNKLNPSERLAGATFELRKYEGSGYAVVRSGTTDSDGQISWTNIPYGTYKLVETKAPDGYNLLDGYVAVVIDNDHIDVSKTIDNIPVQELPSTGGMGTTLFTLIGLGIMLGTSYIYRKKQ